jgi:hypothetical protein
MIDVIGLSCAGLAPRIHHFREIYAERMDRRVKLAHVAMEGRAPHPIDEEPL